MAKEKNIFQTLTTPFEKELTDTPYSEYPRPNLKRASYMSLNGKWKFSVYFNENKLYDGDILVPFVPESKISGVYKTFPYGSRLKYKRSLIIPNEFIKDRVLLHFGAVDRYCSVNVNGQTVLEHDGGYLPFTANITESLKDGENIIEIEVVDDLDTDYPYGKQRKKRGGMWYTPISGIWQSVWLESVCENYIERIVINTDMSSATIKVVGGEADKKLYLDVDGREAEYAFSGDVITVNIPTPKLWSPDCPNIYRFRLVSGKDEVESYFALREISVCKRGEIPCILLNGTPIFMHGLLDQGYFSDGIYMPSTPEGYKNDILSMKELGFNMLRKHIKIEPQLFYYYCDIYGMLVWQDMVNSGIYNFLIDTALPTVGIKNWIKHRTTKKRKDIFETTAKETLELLHNHPSVVYYTIFNEGWGQYEADRIYRELKAVDRSRIYDSTSGWFKEKESDVESLHIYFKPVKLKSSFEKPVVLSEFGGYSYKITGHSFNLDKTYGYKMFEDKDSFERALISLYEDEIIPAIDNGLCASVLTQLSDVEDETNGLYTYDRQVLKVDSKKMRAIADKLYDKFKKRLK